jgi:hypothetical protein
MTTPFRQKVLPNLREPLYNRGMTETQKETDRAGVEMFGAFPSLASYSDREVIWHAEEEHEECVRRWQRKFARDPSLRRKLLLHPVEAHLPPHLGRLHLL